MIWWQGHGVFDAKSGLTTLFTGDEIVAEESYVDKWLNLNLSAWENQETVIYAYYTAQEGRILLSGGITNRFIAEQVKTKKFPNSLVILNVFQGLKDPNERMAKAFLDNGASTIMGWTENVRKMLSTEIASILVFSLMEPTNCFTVNQVYPVLVNETNTQQEYASLRGLLKVQSKDNMKFTLCN